MTRAAFTLVLALGAVAGCAGDAPPSGDPVVHSVQDGSRNLFDPVETRVPAGAGVIWDVVGVGHHTVTFLVEVVNGTAPDSGDLAPGATFRVAFPNAGTFAYWCKYHSDGRTGMTGTVVVG